ncbi:hypothetical protein Syun_025056 [Stephania yunnanensis]|uniref:Tetratricopeptide repeat protein 1 n=1 Tax=Stephania yunnanensis TaxID=152371 RepID=A0AAP0HVF7_9MAGN
MVVIEPASSVDNVETTQNQAETAIREAEGFETASDGEGDGGPYEDAFTDDQLKQRQLAQANDAKADGNDLFKAEKYEDALLKYEIAIQIATEMPSSVEVRSICHANRAACFSKLGKYEDTIKECTKALELNPLYLKALIRRAEAHEKLEHFEEAIADMKKVLELDPSHDQASKSIRRLEPLAAEKREKMKEEMIGKLKEMGNSILGRFGMSVDNFKAVKDPNTGSYSISFQR